MIRSPFACFVVLRASGIKLKFTVMVPEDDHNNTVWVGGSMLASTGALDGACFSYEGYCLKNEKCWYIVAVDEKKK